MYRRYFKRLLDVSMALLLLVLTSVCTIPLMVILAFQHRGKVFFTQLRPGKHGKPFRIIKFRTMSHYGDEKPAPFSEELYLTRIGRFLRRTSLNELPQLVNVLRGELSLIGPRPLLMEYLPLYDSRQARRHEIKPGITGWAQVNGRNSVPWPQRFEYDVWYVDHLSFALDIKIFFLTFLTIIKKEEACSFTNQPIGRFEGNKQKAMVYQKKPLSA